MSLNIRCWNEPTRLKVDTAPDPSALAGELHNLADEDIYVRTPVLAETTVRRARAQPISLLPSCRFAHDEAG